MTETLILRQIPEKMNQLRVKKYHTRHVDFTVPAGTLKTLAAYNEVWYIIGYPMGITINSDYGWYDTTGYPDVENEHEHRGFITINNPDNEDKRIQFIQVIIIN